MSLLLAAVAGAAAWIAAPWASMAVHGTLDQQRCAAGHATMPGRRAQQPAS